MSNRDKIRAARAETNQQLATVAQGKLDAHFHRVTDKHQPGQLIVDAEGDVIMQDVIKHAHEGNMDRAVDSLGVYLAKYKTPNKFIG